jgi:hypothetical protein
MDSKKLLTKAVASVIVLAVFVLTIKYAFAVTWPQGFVLGWLYWLLQDSCRHPER